MGENQMKRLFSAALLMVSSLGLAAESPQPLSSLPEQDALRFLSEQDIPRVIGGTIPKAGTLESIALMVAEGDVSVGGAPAVRRILGLCTSTLISPTAFLSAAHCVNQTILKTALERATGPDGKPLNAKLQGQVEFKMAFVSDIGKVRENPELLLEVVQVYEHEEFALTKRPWVAFQNNPNRWDDISLLLVAEPIKGRRIQKLASSAQMQAEAIKLELPRRFAGYGVADQKDPSTAGVLREGAARLNIIGTNEFVAGTKDNQHACQGDSGGPIYLDGTDEYQIGIASRINKKIGLGDIWGGITGGAKAPSCTLGLVYTRIDPYLPWIQARVEDLGVVAVD
jgi:hypothetical protein